MDNFLNDLLLLHEEKYAQRIYLRQPRQGQWHHFTWAETVKQARQAAQFLLNLGLQRGDKVSIFSKNCAEWFIADFAISLAGLVNVPLFANQHKESIHYVLNHAEVKLVFIGKLDNHKRARRYISDDFVTIGFDYHDDITVNYPWADVLKTEPLKEIHPTSPDDIYTIIYSSGTSGPPKGAVYTHQTIANYLTVFPEDIKTRIADLEFYRLVSYLPLAHVYERTAIQLGSLAIPSDVSFIESLDKFVHNLQEIEPTFFTAVPRIWGIFQQKIEAKLPERKLNFLLKIPLISSIIKRKIRHGLGLTKCQNCFSGASHLPIQIIEFFNKLGIYIQEGYGQTENLAYATFSVLDERRPGYVGTARVKVELKLDANEELLIRSPCLMKAYYKEPEATEQAFSEGWLRTGDVAEIDEKGRLKIISRLTETFKNQKGEFITPTPIEEKFANNPIIEQLCLVGKELPANVLLVTLTEHASSLGHEKIKQCLKDDLKKINPTVASYEKISMIIIAKQAWTVENGLLTPTLKVKRRSVEAAYQSVIEQSMTKGEPIHWEE